MITVIGLGEVGIETFKEIRKRKGVSVYGTDINKELIGELRRKGYNVGDRIPKSDVYIIAVYSTKQVVDVLKGLEEKIQENSNNCQKPLVCIESTLDPARLNDIRIYHEHFNIASFPHRFNQNDKKHHVFNLDRVLGGVSENSTNRALAFYKQFMDKKLIHTTSFEASAISKVLENAYRFMDIAFAESARMDCETQGILFDQIRKAANKKGGSGLDIKEARDGIYKKCLPKDAKLLCGFLDNDFIKLTIDLDERYKRWYGAYHKNGYAARLLKDNDLDAACRDLSRIYNFFEGAVAESLEKDFEKRDIWFGEVRTAANTKWNIRIKKTDWQQGYREFMGQADSIKTLGLASNVFLNNEFLKQAEKCHKEYLEWCARQ